MPLCQVIPASQLFYATDIVGSPFPTTVVPGAADYPYTTAFGPGLANATAGQVASFFIQVPPLPAVHTPIASHLIIVYTCPLPALFE